MDFSTDRSTIRTRKASRPTREAADYIYQAATVAAALLLLLTAAV
jgi:hypothetical protein